MNQEKIYFHDLLNDMFYSEIVFKNKQNGYYVEIGALDGIIHSQSYHFEKFKNWNGIIVEPVPFWDYSLRKNRKCNIEQSPISYEEKEVDFIVYKELSHSCIKDKDEKINLNDVSEILKMNTLTLNMLLDKYNSPDEIDWVSLDIEGNELKVLETFFNHNSKYKINLISLEHFSNSTVENFFEDKPYIRVKNPFLDFLKISNIKGGIYRLDINNKISNINGELYDGPYNELSDILFEFYYLHIDYILKNPKLKNIFYHDTRKFSKLNY